MVVIMYLRPEVHSRHRQMFKTHCVKSVLIRSILVRIFPEFSDIRTEYGEIESISLYSIRMWENARKMRTRITPNKDTFYVVMGFKNSDVQFKTVNCFP